MKWAVDRNLIAVIKSPIILKGFYKGNANGLTPDPHDPALVEKV